MTAEIVTFPPVPDAAAQAAAEQAFVIRVATCQLAVLQAIRDADFEEAVTACERVRLEILATWRRAAKPPGPGTAP